MNSLKKIVVQKLENQYEFVINKYYYIDTKRIVTIVEG